MNDTNIKTGIRNHAGTMLPEGVLEYFTTHDESDERVFTVYTCGFVMPKRNGRRTKSANCLRLVKNSHRFVKYEMKVTDYRNVNIRELKRIGSVSVLGVFEKMPEDRMILDNADISFINSISEPLCHIVFDYSNVSPMVYIERAVTFKCVTDVFLVGLTDNINIDLRKYDIEMAHVSIDDTPLVINGAGKVSYFDIDETDIIDDADSCSDEDSSNALDDAMAEIDTLKRRIEELEADKEKLEKSDKSKGEVIKELSRERNEKIAENDALTANIISLQKEIERRQMEIDKLKAELLVTRMQAESAKATSGGGKKETPAEGGMPKELTTARAQKLLDKLREGGILDESLQPKKLSNAKKGIVIWLLANRLNLKSPWKSFGSLWNVNGETIRAAYNKAADKDSKTYKDFENKIKDMINS
ncbi:MAG: hypothetical protein Q4D41_10890 [Prevotellaceae bacterium]|nr:hypothetical protein [Prevotellaceae bacterium]